MNPNSCEALPGNYRQTREIDFVNLSRENIIGLLLTLVLLIGPVLLVLPSHPFTLLSSAKNTVFSLIYCLGAFLLMVASMRLQAKLHGFCLYKTCGCPVEYVSMGFYIVACTGRMYVRRNSWLTGTLIPAVVWCGLLLAAAFAVSEQWFWIPFLMFLVSLSGWAGKFVAIAVVLISAWWLRNSVMARDFLAMGSNKNAALYSGVPIKLRKVQNELLMGAFAGLSGVLSLSFMASATSEGGSGYEMLAITAVVAGGGSTDGGTASVWGTLGGIALIMIIKNGLMLMGISTAYQQATEGILLVLAIALQRLTNRKTR